jgi:hypothetical protein
MSGMSSETTPSRSPLKPGARTQPTSSWKQLPGAQLIDGVRHRLRERLKSKHPEWDWKKQKLAQLDPDPGGGSVGGGGNGGLGLACLNGFPEPEPLTDLTTTDIPVRADTLPRKGGTDKQNNLHSIVVVPTLVRSNSTGTNNSITSSDYGFQDWRDRPGSGDSVLHNSKKKRQPPPPPPPPPRKQGKSVRFGENRISVFLQDPTTRPALEEVVKLALELEEEEATVSYGGGTVSDSEATLRRHSSSGGEDGHGNQAPFWSDCERDPLSSSSIRGSRHRQQQNSEDEDDDVFRISANGARALMAAHHQHPADRKAFFDGTNGSGGLKGHHEGDREHSQHRHHKGSGGHGHHGRYNHSRERRRREEIHEIFAFIDKVLSGCEDSAEVEARIEDALAKGSSARDSRRRQTFGTFKPQNETTAAAANVSDPRKIYNGTSSRHQQHKYQNSLVPAPGSNSNSSSWYHHPSSCSTNSQKTSLSSTASSCSYRPSSSSQSTSSQSRQGLTPEEALEALQTLTRLTKDRGSKHRRQRRRMVLAAEADGDGDDSGNGKGPSTTTTTLTFSDSDCDDDDDNVSVVSSVLSRAEHYSLRQQRALSPSAAVLMAVLNENGSGGGDDGVGRTSRQQQHSGSRYSSSSRHRRKNHSAGAGVGVVSRRRLGGTAGRVRPTADMFATILLCSSDEAGNRFAKGMTMYKHIHSKITQDVCNAIFLCKVLL